MDLLNSVAYALLAWLSHGFSGFSGWEIVAYTLITTHITIAAVTIFLHRAQAHRALDLHPVPSHFFRFWLWLGSGMTPSTSAGQLSTSVVVISWPPCAMPVTSIGLRFARAA